MLWIEWLLVCWNDFTCYEMQVWYTCYEMQVWNTWYGLQVGHDDYDKYVMTWNASKLSYDMIHVQV